MQTWRGLNLFLMGMIVGVVFLRMTTVLGGESSEFESLIWFLRAVDPQNMLRLGQDASRKNPCLDKWKGVKCNIKGTTILEIRLENSNLSGVLDANSLCMLPNLRVLSLAENRIQGHIPNAILYCRKLTYLNLSSNLLSGKIPSNLARMKYLRKWDISKNHFEGMIPIFEGEFKKLNKFSMKAYNRASYQEELKDQTNVSPESPQRYNSQKKSWLRKSQNWIPLVIGLFLFTLVTYLAGKKASELARDKAILKSLQDSPTKTPQAKTIEEVKPEGILSELVFFVEEEERFTLEDLLEATADLRSQTFCRSLYNVILKNNEEYSVTRLKKLQVSFEDFCQIMRQIGDVKHPNILPLVGYSFTPEDKLLIYKYQNKGSLLNLFEDYIESKRDFPLRLRLSIAGGIARGLNFIFQTTNDHETLLHHGNLKLSNILLDDNDEPLISEFGHSRFLDPKGAGICSSKGYTAPEKSVSEKGDVYSFGVILLELLTGKPVEKTGIDLPKWVNAMIREEWTGEVFDRELAKAATHWAFILLNIALKCVSNLPENRPTMEEVLEKIEEVMYAEQDHTMSPLSSHECHQDTCLLHSIIPETWDTPGSNY
ncbi:probable inactive receptor kinase At2g26730 [Humulus lupulus]|uniref:probable inactive receptor kinase At2g26730 n=1 Tax=Humulus lupulus TaxID=3486 RepID=UPI002B407D8D|nr:probable inactive receptor kinase At2g26730 [Humulus lupulus]